MNLEPQMQRMSFPDAPHVLRGPVRAALKVKKGPRGCALLSLCTSDQIKMPEQAFWDLTAQCAQGSPRQAATATATGNSLGTGNV